MSQIMATIQDLLARGEAVPFSIGPTESGSGITSISAGGDLQWLLLPAASGMGSGFLIYDVQFMAINRQFAVGIRGKFSRSTSGFTDRTSESLIVSQDYSASPGVSLYEKAVGTTSAHYGGHRIHEAYDKPIHMDLRAAPIVTEYTGANDAVIIQAHNDHGSNDSDYALNILGIAWDAS